MDRQKMDFSKLERLCEYRRKRSSVPWNFYHKKIYYISDIIEETDKRIKNERTLEAIREQQVVSLVTALEVYLREMFIYVIDEKNIKSDRLLDSINKNLSLLEVITLHKKMVIKKWKQAELLANEFNFQDLNKVKEAYGKLLHLDLFSQLKKYKKTTKDGKPHQLDKDFEKKIEKILRLRHDIIHDINFRSKVSYNELIDMYNCLHFFVDIFDSYLQEKFIEKRHGK